MQILYIPFLKLLSRPAIASLKSTDEGVAFVVWAEGHSIYHAGDLNWWHWEGEPFPFNENMVTRYFSFSLISFPRKN